ncbi:hypothetical protein FE257_007176 [Aspergillus nanangensis]|uniref:Geranylgeranyl pyrophosphate synthase n=1 Tax=Aspergillus nanangensis TaxID=2582783 RepID=A0AAD4CPZ2_ASPNN|nr:hypothetical protein FE257_007176 [Aspergillus nanangensis]
MVSSGVCSRDSGDEIATERTSLDEIAHYSAPVSSELYADIPAYFSTFKPRIHRNMRESSDASIQCQIDLFGKDRLGMVMGNLNTYCGDWTALVWPFCDPERLALAAYMVDFAFIHDDVDYKETIQTRKFEFDSEIRDKALRTGNHTPAFLDEFRNKQVIAKTMCKLVELDGKRGMKFIQQWENWKKAEKDYVETEAQRCETLDRWANGMARFAYKLTLTEEEEHLVTPLTQLIMNVLTLHNDYFSWDKENSFYNSSEEKLPMSNAVTLYMKWYSMSVEDAKDAIRIVAIHKEQEDGYLFADDCTQLDTFVGYQPSKGQENSHDKLDLTNGNTGHHSSVTGNLNTPFSTEAVGRLLDPLGKSIIEQPSKYIMSLPSKQLRDIFTGALNTWYCAPDCSIKTINHVVGLLHNCSLMLDDIEDQSPLRRGKPAAHIIYGAAQTINSAYFLCIEALHILHNLSKTAVSIYIDELRSLHIGQAQDLYWTCRGSIPSEDDYLRMIDGKTTSLFRMAGRLSQSEATMNKELDLTKFITFLGRYFQIRDDYQNLASSEYASQKGFCEDLDEGKLSLPLIHALGRGDPELRSIIENRKRKYQLNYEVKQLVLDKLHANGSFQYTLEVLQELQACVNTELEHLEYATGQKNWILRMLLHKLKI